MMPEASACGHAFFAERLTAAFRRFVDWVRSVAT